jgi:hypothetical protein
VDHAFEKVDLESPLICGEARIGVYICLLEGVIGPFHIDIKISDRIWPSARQRDASVGYQDVPECAQTLVVIDCART